MRWVIDYLIYRFVRNDLMGRRNPVSPTEETSVGLILGGLLCVLIFGLMATPFLMFAASAWLGVGLLFGAVVGLVVIAHGISIAVDNHRIREGYRSGRK